MRGQNFRKILSVAFLALSIFIGQGKALALGDKLIPMGTAVGIELRTEGILVVGEEKVSGSNISPAYEKGILTGDLIKSINGVQTNTNLEFLDLMKNHKSGELEIEVLRGEETLYFNVEPIYENGSAKLGLWIKDSITGIGTITFYDPSTGTYGALGHGINDGESGILVPVGEGEILDSEIVDLEKGKIGAPGKLCGSFSLEDEIGSIEINSNQGIYGNLEDLSQVINKPFEIASNEEIVEGKAQIISTINGTDCKYFDINITKLNKENKDGKNMTIQVVDKELLKKTGGIVQGMSGSPILQNGKIIGAVTHVLVNDPSMGYGIFISNMIDVAESLE